MGLVLGSTGTGEPRVFLEGLTNCIKDAKEGKWGREGVEGKVEIVFSDARYEQSGVVSPSRGCKLGKKKV